MFYPPVIGFITIIASLLTSNLIILFSACVLLLIVGTVRDPLFMAQIQTRIPSFNRATATSTLNTIKNISDVPLLLYSWLFSKSRYKLCSNNLSNIIFNTNIVYEN